MAAMNIKFFTFDTRTSFQFELLALLASLVLSLLFNHSIPYFTVSAVCLLASIISLAFTLSTEAIASSDYVELTTSYAFACLLVGTITTTVLARGSPTAAKTHAVTTLGCSILLAVKAAHILLETPNPGDLDVSSSENNKKGLPLITITGGSSYTYSNRLCCNASFGCGPRSARLQ
jgi:hypothetical protein